jgi:hypothetical protein
MMRFERDSTVDLATKARAFKIVHVPWPVLKTDKIYNSANMKPSARGKDARNQRRNREVKELKELSERVDAFVFSSILLTDMEDENAEVELFSELPLSQQTQEGAFSSRLAIR